MVATSDAIYFIAAIILFIAWWNKKFWITFGIMAIVAFFYLLSASL